MLHARGLFMQWMGVLAGPVAWGLHMQTNLSLVPWVCKNGGEVFLHVVTILALVVTAFGAFAAWRGWLAGADAETDGAGRISRARFMGALGLLVSAMFFLVIIAQAIPSFMFHPCQR
jgi:hypothetical protein